MNLRSVTRIKSQLLAAPAFINVREAAVRLVSARDRCSPGEALRRIKMDGDFTDVLDLLRLVLPEPEQEWRRKFVTIYDLSPVLGFPINEDYMMDMAEEWRAEGARIGDMSIPLYSLNPTGENYSSVSLAYSLALLLDRTPSAEEYRGSRIDDEVWARLSVTYDLEPADRPEGGVSDEAIEATFSRQRNPLRYIPRAQAVTRYDTGCGFLDFNDEWGDADIEWSRQNVIWLRRDYKDSQRILKRIEKLDEWLKRDTTERISLALRLYRKAQNTDVKKKQTARIPVNTGTGGRALVDVL